MVMVSVFIIVTSTISIASSLHHRIIFINEGYAIPWLVMGWGARGLTWGSM